MSDERIRTSVNNRICADGGTHKMRIATPEGSLSEAHCQNEGCGFTEEYRNYFSPELWEEKRIAANRNGLNKVRREAKLIDQIPPSVEDSLFD